jgi:hypothetical protein
VWIDQETGDKIEILNADFLPKLREVLSDDSILAELGGSMEVDPMNGVYRSRPETGISDEQLRLRFRSAKGGVEGSADGLKEEGEGEEGEGEGGAASSSADWNPELD